MQAPSDALLPTCRSHRFEKASGWALDDAADSRDSACAGTACQTFAYVECSCGGGQRQSLSRALLAARAPLYASLYFELTFGAFRLPSALNKTLVTAALAKALPQGESLPGAVSHLKWQPGLSHSPSCCRTLCRRADSDEERVCGGQPHGSAHSGLRWTAASSSPKTALSGRSTLPTTTPRTAEQVVFPSNDDAQATSLSAKIR